MNNLEVLSKEIKGYKSLNNKLGNYKDLSESNIELVESQLKSIKELTKELRKNAINVNSEIDTIVKSLQEVKSSSSKVILEIEDATIAIRDNTNEVLQIQKNIDYKIQNTLESTTVELINSTVGEIKKMADSTIEEIKGQANIIKYDLKDESSKIRGSISQSRVINIVGFLIIIILLITLIMR